MNQEYKYKGKNLNKKVIRHILENDLPISMYGLSVEEIQERIERYHEKMGGKPAEIKDTYGPVYFVLRELVKSGKFQDTKESKFRYYRPVENDTTSKSDNTLQDFLGVITDECRILHEHIETLKQQIEELKERKSELQEIQDKYESPYKSPYK